MRDIEMARVAGRALSIYFGSWSILDCTYLPQYFFSLVHHLGDSSTIGSSYWKSYYMLETASMILRIAMAALAAIYFWNGGPKIMRLLSIATSEASDRSSATQD